MQKLLILVALVAALHACTSLSSSNADKNKTDGKELSQSTGPDGADLLMILQGRWQSQQDTTYVLEITDTQMRHLSNGQLTSESEIEIDGSCLTTPCKMDSTDLTDGWCFKEKSKDEIQCNIIIACDKEYLKYRAIGASNAILEFKKQ